MKNKQTTKQFSSEEVAGFCDQIAIILKGGISLYDGIYMLLEEVEDKRTKRALEVIEEGLKENKSFYDALYETKMFPDYMMEMVKIGEKTGKLDTVMRGLSQYYERESTMKASIRSVITYPMVMLGMMAVILIVLVVKILPMFEKIFLELSVDAARSSNKLMNAGMIMGKTVAGVTIGFFVIGLILAVWYQTQGGRKKLKGLLEKLPFTKKITITLSTGRFLSSMALMVGSGLDILESVQLSFGVVGHKAIKAKVRGCIAAMKQSKGFPEALKEQKMVSGLQERFITIASRTGVLDEVLLNMSSQYDEEISYQLQGVCTKLETTLVVVLALVIGAVLLSMMLPLVSIISSIG